MAKSSKRFNFTKAAIEAVPAGEKLAFYYDERTRGLAVCVMPSGLRVFYLYRKVKGAPKQIKLGAYPDLTIEQARAKAAEMNAAIARGDDPSQDRKKARDEQTFGDLFTWYLEKHAKPSKKSWHEDEKQYRRYLQDLGKRKLSTVTKADVRALHDHIAADHGPYSANRALALVRSIYNRAIAHDVYEGMNPAIGVSMKKERSRDRRLMGDELPRFFAALEQEPNADIRDYVLISLFTGARQGNVLAMRWDQIDTAARVWRIPETKNGLPLLVTLDDYEVEILARRRRISTSPFVFPGPGRSGHLQEPRKGWERIRERAGMTDLRLHDLRRTLGSWMADTGAATNVIGKALGHQSQTATAIYARLSLDPVREAKGKALGALMKAVSSDGDRIM